MVRGFVFTLKSFLVNRKFLLENISSKIHSIVVNLRKWVVLTLG